MAKNTGKPSEQLFEGHWDTFGKRAYYWRVPDAAEVYGRVGRIGNIRPSPSDYVLTFDGVTSFAEVKSTLDKTAFRFSLLRKVQSGAARMVLSAGGVYDVYLHSLHLNRWFKVPYFIIQTVKEAGQGSIPWADLEELAWTPRTST